MVVVEFILNPVVVTDVEIVSFSLNSDSVTVVLVIFEFSSSLNPVSSVEAAGYKEKQGKEFLEI